MVAFRCTALYTIPCAVLFLTTAQPMLHMLFSKGELNGLDSILKVLAITVIFILYTQRLIHTPMQHLLGAFNRVKKGNFQEHIEEKNNSEFAYLYEGFNEMEDRIQDLIQEVYEQKELKQRAEL